MQVLGLAVVQIEVYVVGGNLPKGAGDEPSSNEDAKPQANSSPPHSGRRRSFRFHSYRSYVSGASLQMGPGHQYIVLALQANYTDVGAQAGYLPAVAAAGMWPSSSVPRRQGLISAPRLTFGLKYLVYIQPQPCRRPACRLGKVAARGGVDNPSGGVDNGPPSVGINAVTHRRRQFPALRAHSGYQQGHLRGRFDAPLPVVLGRWPPPPTPGSHAGSNPRRTWPDAGTGARGLGPPSTIKSCKSVEPGLEPRHQMNAPRPSSDRKGAMVSPPPQGLTVTASKSHTWNMARAYASPEGPMSPLLASPIISARGDACRMNLRVCCSASRPGMPRAS